MEIPDYPSIKESAVMFYIMQILMAKCT